MNTDVDRYFIDGCMRCPLGASPQCKVNHWRKELEALRKVILQTELTEESKWGVPCYTLNGKNVITLSALKEFAAISFFKGSLLQDSDKILTTPGQNSQAARYLKITDIDQVLEKEKTIKAYIFDAIEIEKAGLKVNFKKEPESMPEELESILRGNAKLREAFEALTPGRKRGYILHFSQPKQSQTRISRIEKCIPKILEGKGFHDR